MTTLCSKNEEIEFGTIADDDIIAKTVAITYKKINSLENRLETTEKQLQQALNHIEELRQNLKATLFVISNTSHRDLKAFGWDLPCSCNPVDFTPYITEQS